jgi:two-component system, OmpR family, KDP operon response regulator KdpE
MAEVLLVEDDARIRAALLRALSGLGHGVSAVDTAMAGLEAIVRDQPDVVVLDLGLPDLDGVALLRMVRSVSDVPVIVATARPGEAEAIRTLHSGADDHLVKPFTAEQLDARIAAVLRRARPAQGAREVLDLGGLRIDVTAHEVTLDGHPVELTRLEFELLHHLAQRPGKVVSRRQLMAEVWRQPHGGADKTVDVHLSWLRRKLGETAADPRYLHTVRGVGVKLVVPEPDVAAPAEPAGDDDRDAGP